MGPRTDRDPRGAGGADGETEARDRKQGGALTAPDGQKEGEKKHFSGKTDKKKFTGEGQTGRGRCGV